MRAATRPTLSPPPRAESRSSLAGIMFCVMLGPFVNILDYNVVNVSLPKMMSGLATDVLAIRWVVTCFLISTAMIMPSLGWIGRVFGNKNLYLLLADLRIGFAYLMWSYIWRGLGLGFLYPPVYAVAIRGVPLELRSTTAFTSSLWLACAAWRSLPPCGPNGSLGLPRYRDDAMR